LLCIQERPAFRLFEQTALRGNRSGEGSANVSEEFAFDETFGKGRAVHRNERPARTRSREVKGPCHELLAGSALARNQNTGIAVGHGSDQRKDLAHGIAGADHLTEGTGSIDGSTKLTVFLLEHAPFEGASERKQHGVAFERLGDVVERAGLHGFNRRIDAAEGRHQDDRGTGADLTDLANQLDPGTTRHTDVREHHIEIPVAQLLQRRLRIGGSARCVPGVFEQSNQHVAHGEVVIDDQHASLCGSGRFTHAGIASHGTCQRCLFVRRG
jgi:hypothetical protein